MAVSGRFRSSADLITEVLARLGVLAVGQAQDPEDTAYVNALLDSTFRMLAGLEICFVSDPGSIPGEWFSALADIVAGECATKFGSSPDDFRKLKLAGLGLPPPDGQGHGSGAAARSLKAITRGRPTYERLRVEYL
jgi:hypothetical protein